MLIALLNTGGEACAPAVPGACWSEKSSPPQSRISTFRCKQSTFCSKDSPAVRLPMRSSSPLHQGHSMPSSATKVGLEIAHFVLKIAHVDALVGHQGRSKDSMCCSKDSDALVCHHCLKIDLVERSTAL